MYGSTLNGRRILQHIQLVLETKEKCNTIKGRIAAVATTATYPLLYSRDLKAFITKARINVLCTTQHIDTHMYASHADKNTQTKHTRVHTKSTNYSYK